MAVRLGVSVGVGDGSGVSLAVTVGSGVSAAVGTGSGVLAATAVGLGVSLGVGDGFVGGGRRHAYWWTLVTLSVCQLAQVCRWVLAMGSECRSLWQAERAAELDTVQESESVT